MSDKSVKPNEGKPEKEKPIVVRSTTDFQRLKLERLMKNPEKPVIIPEKPKVRGSPHVPDFVRNVMGSSAGAGSGEFHVYRHLRRKEYARQKYMKEKAERDRLDDEYQNKLEENKRMLEEKTAKKRAKRLKKKQKQKNKGKKLKTNNDKPIKESEESSSEDEASEKEAEDVPDEKDDRESEITSEKIEHKSENDQNETENSEKVN